VSLSFKNKPGHDRWAQGEAAKDALFERINRVAADLDVDGVMRAGAREHLRKLGVIPAEAAVTAADAAGVAQAPQEGSSKPLKSLESDE
jgi:hypothetical protein